MKYYLSLIILFLFATCTNDTPTEPQAQEASHMVMRVALEAEPAPTIIDYPIKNSATDSLWRITTTPTLIKKVTVTTPPPVNQTPSASAGTNQSVVGTTAVLTGSGTDIDGTIVSYLWSKVSGNGSSITQPNNSSTTVTGLSVGTYVYSLKVFDNGGATATAQTTITVNNSNNLSPTNIKTGPDRVITLPTNTTTFVGSATDPDGTIVAYKWVKEVGGAATITNPNVATAVVTGLVQGEYRFRFTVTDNGGATATDTVHLSVRKGSTTPPPVDPPPVDPPPTAGYTLTFSTGYDQLSDMTYGGNGQYGNGTISTSTFKTGPGSFYSRPANVSSGIRSEVQYGGSEQNNTEGAVEYDVMYEVIVPNNGHSFQWHPNTGGGSASPGLWHIGGKFVMVNWKGGGNSEHATGITIQTNKWYHIRMEYKFASNGYFNLFIDGVKNSGGSWTGQVGDGSGQYLKVGYNGWDGSSTSSRIYYDNLKIWRKG